MSVIPPCLPGYRIMMWDENKRSLLVLDKWEPQSTAAQVYAFFKKHGARRPAFKIERMVEYFRMDAALAADNEIMEIDIIGFSRGAAQTRDFANRIVANTTNGWYRYTTIENGATVTHCQRVNFRFMGLWDTVLSTDCGSGPDYQLGIQ